MNLLSFVRKQSIRHQHRSVADYSLLPRIRRSAGLLGALLFLHALAMVAFEQLSFGDAVWLTLTTITTVGYGDVSAGTVAGRTATVGLIYLVGITLLATVASDYIDYRITRRERMQKGQWRWHMQDHIVFINAPKLNAEQYFCRVVTQLRVNPDYREKPVVLLTDVFEDGLPHSLADLGMVHSSAAADSPQGLDSVSVNAAQHIIILARDEYDERSDSLTFAISHRLQGRGLAGRTMAECVLDENRSRLHTLGVRSILRPIRSYPEIVVRAITAPGTEVVLENLFTYGGDHARRYEVYTRGKTWAEIVRHLTESDLGTPMAYVNDVQQVVCQPHAAEKVNAVALIVIVREEHIPEPGEIVRALD